MTLLVKRSILVELDLPRGREKGILGLMIRLCDFLDGEKTADIIIDYGLGLVTSQVEIKQLPTHMIHADDPPQVRRDARSKALERCDQR